MTLAAAWPTRKAPKAATPLTTPAAELVSVTRESPASPKKTPKKGVGFGLAARFAAHHAVRLTFEGEPGTVDSVMLGASGALRRPREERDLA